MEDPVQALVPAIPQVPVAAQVPKLELEPAQAAWAQAQAVPAVAVAVAVRVIDLTTTR